MELTSYQEFVIKTLLFQLNDTWIKENLENVGVKSSIKQMTRLYSEYTIDNDKAYQNIEKYKQYHRITVRASRAIDNNGTKKDVHPEHSYPNEQIFQDLLILSKNKEEIKKEDLVQLLSNSEMIILSKEEQQVLDGSTSKQYMLDGKLVFGCGMKKKGTLDERLKAINATFEPKYEQNSIYKTSIK